MTTQNLNPTAQFWVGTLLFGAMAITRSHHAFDGINLPDASWAIFFLAGALLASRLWWVALAIAATVIDALAIGWGNVADTCVTLAYAMLYPTYAVLWMSGRLLARLSANLSMSHARAIMTTSGLMVATVTISALIAEQIASGSFYFFGGAIANPTWAEYIAREQVFFPPMLYTMLVYVSIALATLFMARAVAASPDETPSSTH